MLSIPLAQSWVLLTAYALGCFSTGWYLVRWKLGKDLRKEGSGSTGARNVGRLLGRWGFILTVVVDVAKGILAVAVVRWVGVPHPAAALAVLAVTVGHIFPVQLRFHGGKGVAVTLGALLILDPRIILGYGIMFGLGMAVTRRVTAGSLVGFISVPVTAWIVQRPPIEHYALLPLVAVILWAHRRNIGSLLRGESGAGV